MFWPVQPERHLRCRLTPQASPVMFEPNQPEPMTPSDDLPRMALSAEEVAEALGISRAHVFRLASSGRLPRALRFGRAVRWDRSTLVAWLAAGAPPRERWEAMQAESRGQRVGRGTR